MNKYLCLLISLLISGCASFGKGITEALLERTKEKDVRICQVTGKAFYGVQKALNKTEGETKVLMVHGVGDHLTGYSTEFLEKLAKELNLTVKASFSKNISLTSPGNKNKKLGNLRVSRFLNKSGGKELLFYELTWSEITRAEKSLLAFDNSGESTFRRTEVNNLMKNFANDTGPDPIIYLGKSQTDILTAFAQSFCWMTKGDWNSLPKEGRHACEVVGETSAEQILYDNYLIVSHSLGSRIVIDGMQFIATMFSCDYENKEGRFSNSDGVINALRLQAIPIFMLSNQLPMLQLGRELPKYSGQKQEFCTPEGKHFNSRLLSKTSIIAFSDPNDLLSYSIPTTFAEKYLDSRLCAEVTNININIANIIDVFGIGKVANPLDAHIGYDTDERVVALIAKGIGNHQVAPIIKKRCEWIET
ncbi:MAG: hypothetical protein KAI17_27010, partial [Thiotrichaceae bacterium]|nr:hypothetical protein [Thiotrichaceae bacterium]